MTLGDHPSATSGPPVTMARHHVAERVVDVDEYECTRAPRRRRKQLKLSYDERQVILKSTSFTQDEIKKQWAEALQIQIQRRETLRRGVILMAFDDLWESACLECSQLSSRFCLLFGLLMYAQTSKASALALVLLSASMMGTRMTC